MSAYGALGYPNRTTQLAVEGRLHKTRVSRSERICPKRDAYIDELLARKYARHRESEPASD